MYFFVENSKNIFEIFIATLLKPFTILRVSKYYFKKSTVNKDKIMQKISSFLFPAFFLLILSFSCSKQKKIGRTPTPVPLPFDGKIINDIVYGNNVDYFGVKEDLDMDIYQPASIVNGQVDKLPLYVYVHGGGFLVGAKGGGDSLMKLMAAKGFIGSTINYRLGWDRNRDGTDPCSGDSTQLKLAIYRAIQDLRASLRFMVAHANEYHIDTNWIFISGASAGAVTILNSTYVDQAYADKLLPGAKDTMGTLDNATNKLTNTFTVKGLGSLWGGLNTDVIINETNAVPTIFFHGELDNVVPYNIGTVYQCPEQLPVYGSKPIYDRLQTFGVSAVAHIDPLGGHGVYDPFFTSDNMACFFQSLIDNNPKVGFFFGQDGSCN